jgi:hypothetical protein
MQALNTPRYDLVASHKELVLIRVALEAHIASADLSPERKEAFQDLLEDVQCITSD